MGEAHHTIKFVARRTGLTQHVIRVWERRYGAVKPNRTDTNRRLYSDEDVERLALLRKAIEAGHSIGNIANLPGQRLQALAAEATANPTLSPGTLVPGYVAGALEAIRRMEEAELEKVLERGIIHYGQHGLLEKLIGPLAQRVGELWREGELTASHEHFATAAIRTFLGRNSAAFSATVNAPVLVVTTPSGQLHELGAIMACAAANDAGWRVVYLGPSLPAAEIASAAVRNQAKAVALSIVYPEDDPNLPHELENLGKYLSPGIHVVVGGRGAEAYLPVINKIGAQCTGSFKELYAWLDEWRKEQK